MSTHSSRRLNSAYFTDLSEARQLLRKAHEVWDLNGKRLLEPSVGSGAFVEAARVEGLNVEWVTNELFSHSCNFQADFNEDFLQLTAEKVGPVDVVVGNPPFSGRVQYGGVKTSLGWAFVLKSLYEHASRAAFVLPPNVLRYQWRRHLPDDTRVVAWSEPEEQTYLLAGAGEGAEQGVKTACALFERTGTSGRREEWLGDVAVPGLEFVDTYDEATHAVSNWGGVALRALDGSHGRGVPYASEFTVVVSDPRVEALLSTDAVNEHTGRFGSGSVSLGREELRHFLNTFLTETP